MISKKEIEQVLLAMTTEKNKEKIEELRGKIAAMPDEAVAALVQEKGIKSTRDIKRIVKKELRTAPQIHPKFEPLNELVSFGVTGKTIHVHLIPKDVRHILMGPGRRENLKRAELTLIDAIEKLKTKMQTERKYKKIENVYAVSGIMSGIIAGWFKELNFDVKVLKMEEAKTDEELKRFTERFEGQIKLGRANLPREILMSEEWEASKEALKSKLQPTLSDSLVGLTNTDAQIVEANESIETRTKEPKEVKPTVIE